MQVCDHYCMGYSISIISTSKQFNDGKDQSNMVLQLLPANLLIRTRVDKALMMEQWQEVQMASLHKPLCASSRLRGPFNHDPDHEIINISISITGRTRLVEPLSPTWMLGFHAKLLGGGNNPDICSRGSILMYPYVVHIFHTDGIT